MDYKLIAGQIVRCLRGDRSQGQVNRKLNLKSNQLHRWEKGHARICWCDFVQLCRVLHHDLSPLFNSYFRYSEDLLNISAFFEHLFAGQGLERISKKVGISPSKLRRIIKDPTALMLDDFLKIIFSLDKMESMAFVHEMVRNRSIPGLAIEREKIDRIVSAYFAHPDLGLLLVCLNLPSYLKLKVHNDDALARITGVPEKKIKELLKLCTECGLVSVNKGKYLVTPFKISDRGGKEGMIRARKFWGQRGVEKLGKHSTRDAFGSIIFTTSNKTRQRIIGLYLRFFEDFKNLVEEDKSPHEIPLVLNFHLFNPGEEP